MLVSKSWCEETAKDIIWEFENLLCNNDVKMNLKVKIPILIKKITKI